MKFLIIHIKIRQYDKDVKSFFFNGAFGVTSGEDFYC